MPTFLSISTHLLGSIYTVSIYYIQAALLISAGGISNTLGRLLGGWMSDHPRLHPLAVTLVTILLCTAPTTALAACWSFATFMICFGAFGVLTGQSPCLCFVFCSVTFHLAQYFSKQNIFLKQNFCFLNIIFEYIFQDEIFISITKYFHLTSIFRILQSSDSSSFVSH